MQSRTETYQLTDGTGHIEVRGNRLASGLFLHGQPFVFNFSDCEGSIGQDLYRFLVHQDDQLPDLFKVTANLPALDTSLQHIVLPLLRQFPSGVYTLTLAPLAEGETMMEYYLPDSAENRAYIQSGYYPFANDIYGGRTLIPTQPEEVLDDNRVAHFWYAIEDGDRPFAITASVADGMCEFILDGHHKMSAYGYARVAPWRLCISQTSLPLGEDDWPYQIIPPPFSWRRVHEWQRSRKP